jgi:V/A-type H+-transporting ATPase subunit F
MKFYLISDNIDTLGGMRLAGIEGVVAHTEQEVNAALNSAVADNEVGLILMTEKLIKLCKERVYDIKLHASRPLIVEIPDRHGTSRITETINQYIKEAVGVII